MPPEGLPEEAIELWPENFESFGIFLRALTQWRTGPAGYIGLDYAGVLAVLRFLRVRPSPSLLDDLQVMEGEALRLFREKG